MVQGDRIETLLEAKAWSQAELARRVGVKSTTIWKLVSGETQNSKHLHVIARELGTTADYLLGDTDDPSGSASVGEGRLAHKSETAASGSVEVQEIDLAFGMGSTYLEDVPVKSNTVLFTRDWLRNFTDAKPEDLFFARGIGDSMMPTILDSDIILIDRSQDSMRMNDQIWALSFGGMGMIKRLRSMPDGSLQIMSDNASVPETSAVDDEAHLIGRVVAVVRKI